MNGAAKVTGATRFTVDIKLPGMLHGRDFALAAGRMRGCARSTSPPPRAIRAFARCLTIARPDDPDASAMRYVGAPVAAVAAVSPNAAEEAAALIRVDYEPLPFVADMDAARERATRRRCIDAGRGAAGPSVGLPCAARLAAPRQRARPGDRSPRRRRAGLRAGRGRRRGRVPHPGADPLLHGAARHRRRLARRRPDRLHVHAVHRRRARGTGARPSACRSAGCA